jgi:parallel beta-helix repeat protein
VAVVVAAAIVSVVVLTGASGGGADAGGAIAKKPSAPKICDRYASPDGRDRNPGTRNRPFKSIPRLAASLRPGQTGCLLPGTYSQDQIIITRGGQPGAAIRIRSAPGTRATVEGRITIQGQVHDLAISGLNLDGRNSIGGASPTVLGDRITFQGNDVTNDHTEICFILGSLSRGYAAEGVVIDGNRIHDCGTLPPENQDHGIYVEYARGTQITNNYIYDNADRGIQLYPDADGTLIANNVIDGNGEGIIFSGSELGTADDNTVRENVISNSRVRTNVEYFYGDGVRPGHGNVVVHNCLYNGAEGDIDGDGIAFTSSDNVFADPGFVDREAKDFRLQPKSPCGFAAPKRTPPPPSVGS